MIKTQKEEKVLSNQKEGFEAFEHSSDSESDREECEFKESELPPVRPITTKTASSCTKDTILLSRIPHGFYENEMNSYFSQFGQVSGLRLCRNKKTGASKHFAFIKFNSAAVASIVVEAMNNYLLSNRLLKCVLVDKEKMENFDLFKGADRVYKPLPWNKMERQRHHKLKTPEEYNAQIRRISKRQAKKRALLKEMGIDFDPTQQDGVPIPFFSAKVAKKVSKKDKKGGKKLK